jgi:DNA-binding MarR family transcriptional regulator
VIPIDFLGGLSVGLAISAAGYLAVRFYRIRRRKAIEKLAPSAMPLLPALPAVTGGPDRARGMLLATPMATASTASGASRPAVFSADQPTQARPTAEPGTARPSFGFTATTQIHVAEPTLQLSHRVILHLYAQGVLPPGEVAPRSLCQAGMRETLLARQGALAAVLQRLEAAGITEAATAHVRGANRRVKVYRLTARGSALARQLVSDRTASARATGRS